MKSALLVVAMAATLCSCASAIRGTTESVSIESSPSDASIRTSLGHSCPSSPCTIEVSRKAEFTAFAEKPGYKPGSIHIGTKMSGGGTAGLAGNILLGGIIGVGVDAATGATLDHYPNPARIDLAPVGSSRSSSKAVIPQKPKPVQSNSPHGIPVS